MELQGYQAILIFMITQTAAGIWWASRMSANVDFLKQLLVNSQSQISELFARLRELEIEFAKRMKEIE